MLSTDIQSEGLKFPLTGISHPVCTGLICSFLRIRLHEVEVHPVQLKAPKSSHIYVWICPHY
jgi:hypothetical protein